MDFAGKAFVVTGGASGIGRALTIELAKRGASVATADVNMDALEETAELARATAAGNTRIVTYKLDVSKLEEWQAFRNKVLEEFGTIDGIINNAGITVSVPASQMTYADLDRVMGINFYGMVYGTKEFLDHLQERPEAVIANVSSVFGLFGVPTQSAYCASKHAIKGYTTSLAEELRETNVLVTSIHPGHIGTNIVRNAPLAEGADEADRDPNVADQFQENGMDPAEAANIILKGIEDKSPRIRIGKDAKMMDRLNRLAPNWFIRKFAERLASFSERGTI